MKFMIERDVVPGLPRTMGVMTKDGAHFGYTLEDMVRRPGEYVKAETAIPEGLYQLIVTYSNRFKREMIQVVNVAGVKIEFGGRNVNVCGIRIHGGNTELDSEGCPLLGAKRMDGVKIYDCGPINQKLIDIVKQETKTAPVFLLIVNNYNVLI